MPTINTGLVDDRDILQNERIIDMAPQIAQLESETTQFTTMMMRARSRPARSSIVEWLEDELFPRRDTTDASSTSAAASIPTSNPTYFRQYDIVRVAQTGEAFMVEDADSASISTGSRGLGDTTAVSIADGDELIIIGNAAAQGATLGDLAVTERVHVHNYTEIFRHPYSFTNTLKASALYGQDNAVAYERRKKAVEHKRAIEYACFLGVRNNDTSGNEPRGSMGGIDQYLSTNDTDVGGGTMTKIELDNHMRAVLQNASNNVVMFVSPIFAQQLGQFVSSDYDVQVPQSGAPDSEVFGARVTSYLSGVWGDRVPIVVKRDWNDFTAGAQYGFNGLAFSVDMDDVWLRPLRPTALLLDRQANDADRTTEEYISECTLEVAQETHHGRLYGITSVA